MQTLSTDGWQKLVSLSQAEVTTLLSAYRISLTPMSPLKAAEAVGGADVMAGLRRRGLVELPGMKPGPEALAVKGALEVLAKPSLELMVVKVRPSQAAPEALTFVVGAEQACLFLSAPEGIHVGAAIPKAQLFSILSRDLKGPKDAPFEPWRVLPIHYHLLLALRHAGLLENKKGFSQAALNRLLVQLNLSPSDAAAIIASAVQARLLRRDGANYLVSEAAAEVMEKLGSGELTELVVRGAPAKEGALPRSILFAGSAGHRIRCDRPEGPDDSSVLSFAPVTQETLGATVGEWLGLSK